MSEPVFALGTRVQAAEDIRGIFRVVVPWGAPGTVVRGGSFGAVMVRFDNGHTLQLSKIFIEDVPAS